jgi:endonuclease/exonuclease/phosphatase family metal-dependent hydrolase
MEGESMLSDFRRVSVLRVSLFALLAALSLFALAGVAQAKDQELTVETRNLYLGSSLDPALTAQTPGQFLLAVAQIYGTVQATNYPARAEALADEIAQNKPDLVGLQEVTKWTATGPGAPPSLDFLAILQQKLAARGLSYTAAATSNNANIGPIPLALCSGPFGSCTLTLQDRDVILVNNNTAGLSYSNPQSGQYQNQQIITSPVGTLSFGRGWATIDATFQGVSFRVANTHLEVESFPTVQQAQGTEFIQGPGNASNVIATGDFNSAADGSTTTTYAALAGAYTDAWSAKGQGAGLTCCQNSPLSNPTSQLSSRIDLVLTRGDAKPKAATVIGNTPFQATQPYWASDHAGVVATIKIK